jgi:hypothetical protein
MERYLHSVKRLHVLLIKHFDISYLHRVKITTPIILIIFGEYLQGLELYRLWCQIEVNQVVFKAVDWINQTWVRGLLWIW